MPHLQYAGKEAARSMATPTRGSMARLKRIGRFLKGFPRCVQHFRKQKQPTRWLVKVDSDYAACLTTRNSTSSNYLFHGEHLIRSSATTQKLPGLSVGETEFMSLVKGAAVGLGAVAMGTDLGSTLSLDIESDSTTAKSITLRRGVGKIRHLHTPLLWVQKRAQMKDFRVLKVDGKKNAADLGTKFLDGITMRRYLHECGFKFIAGKSGLALKAVL